MTTNGARKFAELTAKWGRQAAACKALGLSQPAVSSWSRGVRRPTMAQAVAVEVWSRGEIVVRDWLTGPELAILAEVRPRPLEDAAEDAAPTEAVPVAPEASQGAA